MPEEMRAPRPPPNYALQRAGTDKVLDSETHKVLARGRAPSLFAWAARARALCARLACGR